jgi:hypothetical protein
MQQIPVKNKEDRKNAIFSSVNLNCWSIRDVKITLDEDPERDAQEVRELLAESDSIDPAPLQGCDAIMQAP